MRKHQPPEWSVFKALSVLIRQVIAQEVRVGKIPIQGMGVTSCATDDSAESQSNFDLGKSRLIFDSASSSFALRSHVRF